MTPAVALLCFACTIAAQAAEEPSANGIAVTYGRTSSADFDAPAGSRLSATEFQLVAGALPLARGAVAADLGVDYQYTHFEYSGIAGRDRDLHRLQLPVNISASAGSARILGLLAPGIATSSNVFKDPFDELTGDDLLLSARVEATWPMTAGAAWLAGLAYDNAFGAPALYPVAGIEYAASDRLRLRLAFPDAAACFSASNAHTLQARLFPAGQEWHVVSDELDDDFDYEMEAWRAQFTWSYRAARRIAMDASIGYEFARHHDFIDDQRTPIDTDADPQVFLQLGLRLGAARLPYANGSGLVRGLVLRQGADCARSAASSARRRASSAGYASASP